MNRGKKIMMRNSKYTQEFRDSTIQLVMQGDKSVLQIGRDLDVNPKTASHIGCNYFKKYKKCSKEK